jgi:hypothetical protein
MIETSQEDIKSMMRALYQLHLLFHLKISTILLVTVLAKLQAQVHLLCASNKAV